MKQFTCPNCKLLTTEFHIYEDNEEKERLEENYNKKYEEFKKIVEDHNKEGKTYEEEITKKLRKQLEWRLYYNIEGRTVDGRTYILCGIEELHTFNYVYLPVNSNLKAYKYDRYKYIQCDTCEYKYYIV